ncbi:MAG: hypothetical protein IT376_06195 [Polyangiaceae bacterium]|nr:hypothetical protein [Polyangiaceae bacterium]
MDDPTPKSHGDEVALSRHGPIGGLALRAGLHGDASRCVVASRVASDEREHTMLELVAQSLTEHGKCDAPYVDHGATFLALETHVQDLRCDRVHPVFVLDEAHLLHSDLVAHLHILMNHEWDARALLSLLLVALPELEGNLQRRAPPSLLTRIHHCRLIVPAALHEPSQGAPREIDRLATAARRDAARCRKKLVDRDVVTRVGEASSASPDGTPPPAPPRTAPARRHHAGAAGCPAVRSITPRAGGSGREVHHRVGGQRPRSAGARTTAPSRSCALALRSPNCSPGRKQTLIHS